MSDNSQNTSSSAAPSPEEVEAAMAANASDELARLQGELAELKAKSAELADQFLRAKAEAENARRRAEDEVAKARKFGIESFAESLLPVADSLRRGDHDRVVGAVDRENLWRAQTPQAFRLKTVRDAYAAWPAEETATDEAAVVEASAVP